MGTEVGGVAAQGVVSAQLTRIQTDQQAPNQAPKAEAAPPPPQPAVQSAPTAERGSQVDVTV